MDRIPVPGAFYRHFKNKLYQVVAVATHSETGEQMVVYQALYGDYKVYVRPLDMFLSPVDREKYPDASQTYRFERVMPGRISEGGSSFEDGSISENSGLHLPPEPDPQPQMENRYLDAFLDASDIKEKLELLKAMEGHVGQRELDCICLSLGLKAESEGKTAGEQLEAIRQSVLLMQRYDGSHLRRRDS